MPFRLKNVWETYEKIVYKMLKDLVEKIIEVHVDDMMVNCKKKPDHIAT